MSNDQTKTPPIIRLSVSEAARLFGVTTQTIRRAIKTQEVNYVVVQGRYKLSFENLLKWSQKRKLLKDKLENQGIGQFVDKWRIKNKLYSPNPAIFSEEKKESPPLKI